MPSMRQVKAERAALIEQLEDLVARVERLEQAAVVPAKKAAAKKAAAKKAAAKPVEAK